MTIGDLLSQCVPLQWLIQIIGEKHPRIKIILIDACNEAFIPLYPCPVCPATQADPKCTECAGKGKTTDPPLKDSLGLARLTTQLQKFNTTVECLETVMMQTADFTLAKGDGENGGAITSAFVKHITDPLTVGDLAKRMRKDMTNPNNKFGLQVMIYRDTLTWNVDWSFHKWAFIVDKFPKKARPYLFEMDEKTDDFNINGMGITDKQTEALKMVLKKYPAIRTVNLGKNKLDSAIEALLCAQGLAEIHLPDVTLQKEKPGDTIYADMLAKVITQHASFIIKLDMHGMTLNASDIKIIAPTLGKCVNMTYLDLSPRELVGAAWTWKMTKIHGDPYRFKTLAKLEKIEHLALQRLCASWTRPEDWMFLAIRNPLRVLDLNGAKRDSCVVLRMVTHTAGTLQELHVSTLSEINSLFLDDALNKCTHLRLLDVSHTGLSGDIVDCMVDANKKWLDTTVLCVLPTLSRLTTFKCIGLDIDSVAKIREKLTIGELVADPRPTVLMAYVVNSINERASEIIGTSITPTEARLLAAQYDWVKKNKPQVWAGVTTVDMMHVKMDTEAFTTLLGCWTQMATVTEINILNCGLADTVFNRHTLCSDIGDALRDPTVWSKLTKLYMAHNMLNVLEVDYLKKAAQEGNKFVNIL